MHHVARNRPAKKTILSPKFFIITCTCTELFVNVKFILLLTLLCVNISNVRDIIIPVLLLFFFLFASGYCISYLPSPVCLCIKIYREKKKSYHKWKDKIIVMNE